MSVKLSKLLNCLQLPGKLVYLKSSLRSENIFKKYIITICAVLKKNLWYDDLALLF